MESPDGEEWKSGEVRVWGYLPFMIYIVAMIILLSSIALTPLSDPFNKYVQTICAGAFSIAVVWFAIVGASSWFRVDVQIDGDLLRITVQEMIGKLFYHVDEHSYEIPRKEICKVQLRGFTALGERRKVVVKDRNDRVLASYPMFLSKSFHESMARSILSWASNSITEAGDE